MTAPLAFGLKDRLRVGRKKRNRLEIITDILRVCQKEGEINKTALVYGANLNFKRAETYLKLLTKMGLINVNTTDAHDRMRKRKLYCATKKGRAFLDDCEHAIS